MSAKLDKISMERNKAVAYMKEDANTGTAAETLEGSSLSLTIEGEKIATTTETVTKTEEAKLNEEEPEDDYGEGDEFSDD